MSGKERSSAKDLKNSQRRIFANALLSWWHENKREFPWRKTKDPYKILIAELLLRKTTAKQVEALYDKFLFKYPSPKYLADASEDDIRNIIKPLGMEHKRAILLKAVGRVIADKYSGQIPSSKEDLLEIPGVGAYAANAVLCLAYGKDVPLVDTNAVRVFYRVFGFKSKRRRPKDDPALWDFVTETIPPGRAREFNLAVIDFAHTVCTPKKPKCAICPLHTVCKFVIEAGKIEDR